MQSLKDHYPDRVTLVDGDINNKQVVVDAAKGCDMIFSAVVDHDDAGNNRPTKNIIATAEANKISRVIETSLLGIYDEVPGKFGKWNRDFCFGGNPEGSAATNADKLLEDSGLDYTTLRLPSTGQKLSTLSPTAMTHTLAYLAQDKVWLTSS